MVLFEGDKVKVLNAAGIECNDGYFKDGDITRIVLYKGHKALAHSNPSLEGGLVISKSEYDCIEVLASRHK